MIQTQVKVSSICCVFILLKFLFLFPFFLVCFYRQGYCSATSESAGAVPATPPTAAATLVPGAGIGTARAMQLGSAVNAERVTNSDPLNGRVMIIDGTSIIHRAYYKLLGTFRFLYSFQFTLNQNCVVHFLFQGVVSVLWTTSYIVILSNGFLNLLCWLRFP